MTLDALRQVVEHAPTIMDARQEVEIARLMMVVPPEDVAENWSAFDDIADRLYESHTDTFYEVDKQNLPAFLEFAQWLDRLADREHGDRAVWLRQLAEHFRIDPRHTKL